MRTPSERNRAVPELPMMLMLLATVEQNALSVWVRESPSLLAFPFILYLHTLGLAMLAGINVGLDLWLLGATNSAVLRSEGHLSRDVARLRHQRCYPGSRCWPRIPPKR